MKKIDVRKNIESALFSLIAVLLIASVAVSCSNEKSEQQMKDEISAAFASATDSINNAPDAETAAKINEQLQAKLASIQEKYKDVTENMTPEQKQTIAEFYKEQKELLYKNANNTGKQLIDAVSSATENAFGATVSTAAGAVNATRFYSKSQSCGSECC